MIKVVFKFKLKPDVSVEDYLVIAREAISETRKEKGCISYTINVDINYPTNPYYAGRMGGSGVIKSTQ